MIEEREKINGIVYDLYSLKKNKEILLIFCPGIPGTEKYSKFAKKFASKGFIFLHPKYRGSYGSEGEFKINNCKKTIIEIIEKISKEGININSKKITPKEIYLIGHSFGGSLALCLSAKIQLKGVIALAPIIDYRKHYKENERNEENLEELYKYINSKLKNRFKGLKEKDWKKFVKTGNGLNPIDYVEELKDKKIFLAHGKKDKSVSYIKTQKFFSLLKEKEKEILIVNCAGHSNIREKSSKDIIRWIKKISKNS